MLALTDFTFIVDLIKDNYCNGNGRNSTDPVVLFKCLYLKSKFKLSDTDLMKRILPDMSFKCFLGYEPEYTDLFDSSVLTKFRRNRLKNVDLGNTLIAESLTIAKNLGLISSTEIIIDAKHTKRNIASRL